MCRASVIVIRRKYIFLWDVLKWYTLTDFNFFNEQFVLNLEQKRCKKMSYIQNVICVILSGNLIPVFEDIMLFCNVFVVHSYVLRKLHFFPTIRICTDHQ